MSVKKRPDDKELRNTLFEGNFGQARELPPADPVTRTQLKLKISEIKIYEHNPRRQKNPRYSEIRESIKAKRGLDNPVAVTRRPGEALYTVRAGGNTRLTILKELFQETGEEAFSRADCVYFPWVSESDCIASHLIENEMRGDLVLIDKALAIQRLMTQLENEHNGSLSRQALERKLKEIGYSVSRRQLIRFEYATDVLYPRIPQALEAGFGVNQIDGVRDAEKLYLKYWQQCGLETEDFQRCFYAALEEHDSDGWDLKAMLNTLEARIAKATEQSINVVRFAVDGLRSGIPKPVVVSTPVIQGENENPFAVPSSPAQDAELPDRQPESADNVLRHDPDARSEKPLPNATSTESSRVPTLESNPADPVRTDSVPTRRPPEPREGEKEGGTAPFLSEKLNGTLERKPSGHDLKSLHSRAYILATRFAQSFGCQSSVKSSKLGYGFFIDLPDQPLQALGDIAWWGWWLLFSLSEQAVTKARLTLAPTSMRLPRLLIEDRQDEFFALTGDPPDAIQNLGHVFFSSPNLSDQAFGDLLSLIETCRSLRNGFSESQLWA